MHRTLTAALMSIGLAGAAWAGTGEWTVAGLPPGGAIARLAVAPQAPRTVYASAVGYGLFRSDDRGESWQAVAAGVPRQVHFDGVAVNPLDPRTVYAGRYQTSDGGVTWTLRSDGPFARGLFAMAFAPARPAVVYATDEDGTLFRSGDGAVHWSAMLAHAGGALAVAPSPDGDTLFVGTVSTLLRSTDGGTTWASKRPAAADAESASVTILCHPREPRTVLFGTSRQLFLSRDLGETWKAVRIDGHRLQLGVDGIQDLGASADGATLYAGLYGEGVSSLFQSGDSGLTWMPATRNGAFSLIALRSDPANPQRIYAAAREGVFRSDDGGRTWAVKDQGLTASYQVSDLAADPTRPSTLFAIADGGVSRSRDGGVHWHFLQSGIYGPLAVAPTRPATLFSADAKGTDDGNSWQPFDFSFAICTYSGGSIADPADPATVYLSVVGEAGYGCGHNEGAGGLWKSGDGGLSWHELAGAPKGASLTFGPPRGTLYALTNEVQISHDGGVTWSTSDRGLPDSSVVMSLAVSPLLPWLYAAVLNDLNVLVFRSEDGGGSWTQAGPSPLASGESLSLAVDPRDPSIVYAYNGDDPRFFRSLDAAETWTEFSAGLGSLRLLSLLPDPTRSGRVLAGTTGGAVMEIDLPPAP